MSLRIALYSPGMVGLGHVRRNLLLARKICASRRDATVLMLTEAREASVFQYPSGVDCVSLPGLKKGADGSAAPRHLSLPLAKVVELRAAAIHATLDAFDPDVLIVDHLPRGARGELEPALSMLKKRGRSRVVLGLRDILDEPDTVAREWEAAAAFQSIAEFYDTVWIYGDPDVFDAITEYSFPAWLRARTRYTGYLDPRTGHSSIAESVELLAHHTIDDRRLVLCQLGGGQDGMRLARAFAEATFPPDTHGILLTGPFLGAEERAALRQLGRMNARLEIVDFIAEPMLLQQRAAAVVAMGGYNSICEVMAFRKRALIVPRARPRSEQRMRAERLAERGIVDMLPMESVTANALTEWFARMDDEESAWSQIRIDGLERAAALLDELLLHEPRSISTLPVNSLEEVASIS
jgi:predicted glycosyltransferase